mgnify:CR=1 FL=1
MKKFFAAGGWTKEQIFDQLSPLYDDVHDKEIPISFSAEDISDEAAQTWVNKHQVIQDKLLSEDRYCDEVIEINDELIIKVLGKDPRD